MTGAIDVEREETRLRTLSVGQLRSEYEELAQEPSRSRHRDYLIRRILWLLQAREQGGLSEDSRRLAESLARESDIRTTPPKTPFRSCTPSGPLPPQPAPPDPRLPKPGGTLIRDYRDRRIRVMVLVDGFEYEGTRYRSLSAIAKVITGSHINGFRFFGLRDRT